MTHPEQSPYFTPAERRRVNAALWGTIVVALLLGLQLLATARPAGATAATAALPPVSIPGDILVGPLETIPPSTTTTTTPPADPCRITAVPCGDPGDEVDPDPDPCPPRLLCPDDEPDPCTNIHACPPVDEPCRKEDPRPECEPVDRPCRRDDTRPECRPEDPCNRRDPRPECEDEPKDPCSRRNPPERCRPDDHDDPRDPPVVIDPPVRGTPTFTG